MHLDDAAHHIDDVLRNRHAQACSLNPAYRTGFFTGERVKDCLLEFFAHPDSVILDSEFKCGKLLYRRWFLNHPEADRSAGRGELDRV